MVVPHLQMPENKLNDWWLMEWSMIETGGFYHCFFFLPLRSFNFAKGKHVKCLKCNIKMIWDFLHIFLRPSLLLFLCLVCLFLIMCSRWQCLLSFGNKRLKLAHWIKELKLLSNWNVVLTAKQPRIWLLHFGLLPGNN